MVDLKQPNSPSGHSKISWVQIFWIHNRFINPYSQITCKTDSHLFSLNNRPQSFSQLPWYDFISSDVLQLEHVVHLVYIVVFVELHAQTLLRDHLIHGPRGLVLLQQTLVQGGGGWTGVRHDDSVISRPPGKTSSKNHITILHDFDLTDIIIIQWHTGYT